MAGLNESVVEDAAGGSCCDKCNSSVEQIGARELFPSGK